MHENSFEDEQI